jgi:putative toxin-antitoxin system antitoxin component (TIGR02293 family)
MVVFYLNLKHNIEHTMSIFEHDFMRILSDGKITTKSNAIDEIDLATNGVKAAAILILAKQLQWATSDIARAIGTTSRALQSHSHNNKTLNMKISENALEVARLSNIGIAYFGNIKRWNEWLNKPHIQFDQKQPKSVMHTIRGRELIKRIILGLEYGFAA